MPEEPKLILTSPPSTAREATAFGLPVGHMAYRVGPGAHLLRSNISMNLRGGLMVVDSTAFDGRGDPATFCQQLVRECTARGFDGAILDFEGQKYPLLGQIIHRLGGMFSRRGWPLFVTEAYADYSDQTKVIIPSALSGGSLSKRLEEAVQCYGASRVALGIQRTAEDFTLPSPTGCGTALTREELEQRIQSRGASVFFSDELCAHYFTYMTRQSSAHFVLFDNAASIRKKIHIAGQYGLHACILAWPEVDDIFPMILK